MKTVHKIAIVGAVLAAAGLTAAATASASHASSSQAGTSIEKTMTVKGQPMGFLQSQYIPKVTCPDVAPYMLKQMYNPGSGFRNTWGVELSDYKSGLDASISHVSLKTLPDGKEAATGLSGVQDPLWNTVTNWALEQNSFTLTMHCTSDIDKAVYWNK